jgi:hypothetical protein
MQRRQLLKAAALAPLMTTLPVFAAGKNKVAYSRAAYEQALGSGEPFILDFYASW